MAESPLTLTESGETLEIRIDDGKANVLTAALLKDVRDHMAQFAAKTPRGSGVLVIRGREGILTGGLDMKVFTRPGVDADRLRHEAAHFLNEFFCFPGPTIIAATGHAVAAGAMLLVSAEHRIGVDGDYRIGFNEVAAGLPLPDLALELAKFRLSPRLLPRATVGAHMHTPQEALEAGFLDEVVDKLELDDAMTHAVQRWRGLGGGAFRTTKQKLREQTRTNLARIVGSVT